MADQARKQTDKILRDMEKEVDAIYSRASKEISAKWDKYMESHKGKVEQAYNDLQEALKFGSYDDIKEARDTYERTVKNVTLNNDRYKAMVKETSAKLSHTNEVALDYVNGNMAKIYTLNYNEFANQDINGYTFTLVNEQAVKDLATKDKNLLPKKKIDIPKDMAWNTKSINAEILQGLLQGENIDKIAKRLTHVTDMDRNSSIRNARTMVTSAENKGRQDSFEKAASDGVIMKRRWVATNDDRTRAAHVELDGVEVDIDEPWENEYGEIMYPGDPNADPCNVYNCRCSIRSVVQGFKWNEKTQETEDGKVVTEDEAPKEETEIKSTEDVTVTNDPVERLQSSIAESYEYHRTHNNLNLTSVDELGNDYFDVQLTKMDDDLKESIIDQFDKLSSKYDTTVQTIRPMDKMEYLAHKDSFATTFHNYEVDNSTIIYNPAKITDVDRIKELVNNGYATQINDEFANRYVITHEFAHTLIDMGSELNNSRNWAGADYKQIKSIRKEINGVYDRYIAEIGKLDKEQKAVELDAITTMNTESWNKAKELAQELSEKSLGKYSMVNADEFMAECFAHSELGGSQNDYVDEVMDIINEHFRR